MLRLDDCIDLQLTRIDHLHINLSCCELIEQPRCHMGMASQPDAAHRDFGNLPA